MRAFASMIVLAVLSALAVILVTPAGRPLAADTPSVLVYRQGTYALRLTDEPCDLDARDVLESDGIPPARIAYAEQGGRRSVLCWAADISGDVMTLDAAGRDGTVPIGWFRREPHP